MMQCSMIRYDTMQKNTIWYDIIRYNTTQHCCGFKTSFVKPKQVGDFQRKFGNYYGLTTRSTPWRPFCGLKCEICSFSHLPTICDKKVVVRAILTKFYTHASILNLQQYFIDLWPQDQSTILNIKKIPL